MTLHTPDTWLSQLDDQLAAQLRFLLEADRLKSVLRGSRIADGSRRENTADTVGTSPYSPWSWRLTPPGR